MIRITRLTNKYGKCGAFIEFEESKDAALYLWGKEVCNFLISKDGHKFETSSTEVADIERELDNFVDGWDIAPRKDVGSINQFSFTATLGEQKEDTLKTYVGSLSVGKHGFGVDFDYENDLRKKLHGNYRLYVDLTESKQ